MVKNKKILFTCKGCNEPVYKLIDECSDGYCCTLCEEDSKKAKKHDFPYCECEA